MCFKKCNLHNTVDSYGAVAKLLHWVMAVLMISVLIVGLLLEDYEKTPEFLQLIGLHKEFGIVVLLLACIRLGWKVLDISPSLPASMSNHAKIMAKLGHLGLYFLMFGLPITGWVISSAAGYPVSMFGLFDLPMLTGKDKDFSHDVKEIHELFANGLMALLALHVLAALLHHFYYKDNILTRMLPNCKRKSNVQSSDISTGC